MIIVAAGLAVAIIIVVLWSYSPDRPIRRGGDGRFEKRIESFTLGDQRRGNPECTVFEYNNLIAGMGAPARSGMSLIRGTGRPQESGHEFVRHDVRYQRHAPPANGTFMTAWSEWDTDTGVVIAAKYFYEDNPCNLRAYVRIQNLDSLPRVRRLMQTYGPVRPSSHVDYGRRVRVLKQIADARGGGVAAVRPHTFSAEEFVQFSREAPNTGWTVNIKYDGISVYYVRQDDGEEFVVHGDSETVSRGAELSGVADSLRSSATPVPPKQNATAKKDVKMGDSKVPAMSGGGAGGPSASSAPLVLYAELMDDRAVVLDVLQRDGKRMTETVPSVRKTEPSPVDAICGLPAVLGRLWVVEDFERDLKSALDYIKEEHIRSDGLVIMQDAVGLGNRAFKFKDHSYLTADVTVYRGRVYARDGNRCRVLDDVQISEVPGAPGESSGAPVIVEAIPSEGWRVTRRRDDKDHPNAIRTVQQIIGFAKSRVTFSDMIRSVKREAAERGKNVKILQDIGLV